MERQGLSLAQIAAIKDLSVEPVEVKEWGGTVYLRSFSAGVRQGIVERHCEFTEDGKVKVKDHIEMQFSVLRASLCDAEGNLIADSDEGVKALKQRNPSVIDSLAKKAMELNGLGLPEKNSEAGQIEPSHLN